MALAFLFVVGAMFGAWFAEWHQNKDNNGGAKRR